MNKEASSQPLVSIVINCYNGEKYLKKAIDSVIAQSYKNWEIVFWDNQSIDKSADIFKSYNDQRLNYYRADKHTKILYKARNFALKKTKGEFIAFLDVDDWWTPDKLKTQIPLFDRDDIGMVYGNAWLYLEKKAKKKIYRKSNLPTGMIADHLLNDYSIGSPTYVIRKKTLESLNYYFNDNFHIIGDFEINIRIASKWKVNCVQAPIAFIRIHGKNESILKRELEISEMKIWYEEMLKNPIFSNLKNLYQFKKKFLYLEAMEFILKHEFKKSFLKVAKYPLCLKKIKLIIALLLPKLLLKKIKNY